MKKKLFGQGIEPDCIYCENTVFENGYIECCKRKQIRNGKCRTFRYDPLLRIPQSSTFTGTYTDNDFKLF